jgi:hypothetical protein
MKRNIYSYSKLWMIFFVLMGAACTNQVEDAIPVSGQPIGFSVQSDWKEIYNSRSNDKTQFGPNDQIQIFGFHKPSKDAVENVQFMYQEGDQTTGQKVVYNGKDWDYTPKRFWPKKGVLDFFASYPYNSVHYDVGNKRMTYDNPLTQDLLYGLATNRDCASKETVSIWMVHALAKVKINLDKSSLGNIGQVIVSGYKTGHFSPMNNNYGVPVWEIDDKTSIDATFHKFGDKVDEELLKENSVTVFILPEKITGLQMWDYDGKLIDASEEIKKHTFLAGKVYNLTISKSNGVRKKNTNSRSIAMSVRCVSE